MSLQQTNKNQTDKARLDKWLWAARFYKTRSISREMINGGKVYYNGQRTKPSKTVELGATIKLRQGHDEKTIIIIKISEQRKSAAEAALLYVETEESIKARELNKNNRKMLAQNPHPEKRPDKKQRRKIMKFKQSHNSEN